MHSISTTKETSTHGKRHGSLARVASALALGSLALLSVSCGGPDTGEFRSELLGVEGSGEHEVCATDVNVRSPTNIATVIFTSKQGDRVLPQGKTANHVGRLFHLVKFTASAKLGYVANDYLCKVGTTTLGAPKIDVNLTTNRLTFYRGNTVIRSWNVVTGKAAKPTPVGTFKVRTKQVCPHFSGSAGNLDVKGCIPANPLGTRALWWKDTMDGLHGTNQPGLLAEGTTADKRRESNGCVRSLNANIEWLYDQVKVGDAIHIHR